MILRPLKESDITDEYVRWWRRKAFTKYLETKTMTKQKAIKHLRETKESGGFLCAVAVDGVHVGNVKLLNRVLSVIIFPPYWGRGYGSAAIDRMYQYVGGPVTAGVRSGNIGCLRAFKKAGFVETGRAQDVIYLAKK